MHPFVLGLVLFITSISVIELVLYARRMLTSPERRKLKRRLKDLPGQEREALLNSILREESMSEVPLLNRLLQKLGFVHRLKRLKEQANGSQAVGFYLLLSLALATAGAFAVWLYSPGVFAALLVGAAGLSAPWLYLLRKKQRRMERFRHQLPEAMEFIARSLKAGHAFTSGLKLASEQMDDPLGVEFAATLHEINFGVGVSDALRHLAERVDCPDLHIFVIAVILQRETGGNLAEIMENNAYIIRERFKFQNHVKTLSAEGKLSGLVLFLLPIFVFAVIQILNPDYMAVLYTSPTGQNLLWLAGGMMIVG
ncbi:MAG: type II secretion system F family protein, partial [Thermodesulfobacteriota bacterium]